MGKEKIVAYIDDELYEAICQLAKKKRTTPARLLESLILKS